MILQPVDEIRARLLQAAVDLCAAPEEALSAILVVEDWIREHVNIPLTLDVCHKVQVPWDREFVTTVSFDIAYARATIVHHLDCVKLPQGIKVGYYMQMSDEVWDTLQWNPELPHYRTEGQISREDLGRILWDMYGIIIESITPHAPCPVMRGLDPAVLYCADESGTVYGVVRFRNVLPEEKQ